MAMRLALSLCTAASNTPPDPTTFPQHHRPVNQPGFALGVNRAWAWDGGDVGEQSALLLVGQDHGGDHHDGGRARALHRTTPRPSAPRVPGIPDVWTSLDALDLRVVRAYGSKGYNTLRISVVTHAATNDTAHGLFTYSHPFRYRWTQLFLRSGLLTVAPGQETALTIDGVPVRLRLPQEDAGVRGIVLADPCMWSRQ